MVIEFVGSFFTYSSGRPVNFNLTYISGGQFTFVPFTFVDQGSGNALGGQLESFAVNTSLRLYADPGTTMFCTIGNSTLNDVFSFGSCTIAGYLIQP